MPFPSLLPRPLFFLLFLAIPLLAQMPLRHTFDTREMCNSRFEIHFIFIIGESWMNILLNYSKNDKKKQEQREYFLQFHFIHFYHFIQFLIFRCNGQCGSENSSDHPGLPRWVCIMNGQGTHHPKNTRYVVSKIIMIKEKYVCGCKKKKKNIIEKLFHCSD